VSDPVKALSDRVLFGLLSEAPELALNLGVSEVAGRRLPDDGMPDFSAEGAAHRERLMRGWADELRHLPIAPASMEGLTREVLQYFLREGFLNRFYGEQGCELAGHIHPLTHITGIHAVAVDMFTRDHPLAVERDMECYVERLSKLPRALRDAAEVLRSRRQPDLIAPRQVLERALADIRQSLCEQPEEHVFHRTLAAAPIHMEDRRRAHLLDSAARLIGEPIRVAYEALLAELETQASSATVAGSPAAGADYEAFYAWRFAGYTTTKLTPEEGHALGLEELSRLDSALQAEFRALGVSLPRRAAFEVLAARDRYSAGESGRIEALEECRMQVARAGEAVRSLFGRWPRAGVHVRPIQPEMEQSRHSHYVPPRAAAPTVRGDEDASSGVFWVNLRHLASGPRWETATICFHETWPGHHVQLALAQELSLPAFRRAVVFDAYLEGWAKYSESLPESVALADSALARIARLRMELYSTATLVLDTGVHVLGWSLDRAREFFRNETGAGDALADMVVLRSAATPGQLCAYKIGLLKMRELRDRFKRLRGSTYRIQDFHDAVLGQGALPLAILESVVDRDALRPRRETGP
jgi:uncharacterized protein (DUF885 family)